MLNSCLGKGIVDTGCAKMMMGSDTFQQYLGLLNSKERASIVKVREKKQFRFGDNEQVAIVPGDAPFLMIPKSFLQRMGAFIDSDWSLCDRFDS